jgi:hypothetical protein
MNSFDKRNITNNNLSDWIKLYFNEKLSYIDIAERYKVSESCVRRNIKDNGYKTRGKRKFTLNEQYFNIINSEEKAYFLGLLYADGCNTGKGISISLQDQDKYILELFNKSIDSNRVIKFQKRYKESYKDINILYIHSPILCNKLEVLGCIKKKSLILNFPTLQQVPRKFVRHFIRGYFDGDGCISILYKDNKIRHISVFMCGTLDMMNGIQNFLTKEMKIKFRISKHSSIFKIISSHPERAAALYNLLYKNSSICLTRKKNKFIELINYYKDKYESIRTIYNSLSL